MDLKKTASTVVPRIHIMKVVQGYRDVLHEKAVGSGGASDLSQSCNNDATCPLVGEEWNAVKQSVVQIITDGGSNDRYWSSVCTGTLLNNENKHRYVLTAYHCLEGESVSNWGFVFNYEKECESNMVKSKFKHFLNGAKLVWADRASDTILLEIEQDIPSDFNAYFSGWNARAYNPENHFTLSFHHPSGDFKKLSFDSNKKASARCPFCGSEDDSHILVKGWDDGTTERGSSGCALFDSEKNVIGVLSGGSARCPDNTGFDLFGKLQYAYDSGLKHYVAPSGEYYMAGEWQVNQDSALTFEPDSLALMENGPNESVAFVVKQAIPAGDVIVIHINPTDEEVIEISPKVLSFDSTDYTSPKTVTVMPKDNKFTGDVKSYLNIEVQHSSGLEYNYRYPILLQDDEHVLGDSFFEPITVQSLPYTFTGDTGKGYTNTYQSKCEFGSSSPDVVFEYVPKVNETVEVDVCKAQIFDSVLYILEDGEEQWCNDDGCQGGMSAGLQRINLQAGKTYHIVIDGYNGAKGKFEFEMRKTPQYVSSFSEQEDTQTASNNSPDIPQDTFTVPSNIPQDTFTIPQDTFTVADIDSPLGIVQSVESEKFASDNNFGTDAEESSHADESNTDLIASKTNAFMKMIQSRKTQPQVKTQTSSAHFSNIYRTGVLCFILLASVTFSL